MRQNMSTSQLLLTFHIRNMLCLQLKSIEDADKLHQYLESKLENRFDVGFTKPTCRCTVEDVPNIIEQFALADLCTPELTQYIEGKQNAYSDWDGKLCTQLRLTCLVKYIVAYISLVLYVVFPYVPLKCVFSHLRCKCRVFIH